MNPPDDLPFSPAAERNRGPILEQLARWLPAEARVLEVASGTGQHAAFCAAAQPGWQWQPSEADATALPAMARRCAGLPNVPAPLRLDVLAPWPTLPQPVDAVFCANLLHISPWASCAALMQGAARVLAPGGGLAVYGPFIVDGEPTGPGNLAFDADLRARHPAWGLRSLTAVVAEAERAGLQLVQGQAMPANNLLLWFRPRPLQ